MDAVASVSGPATGSGRVVAAWDAWKRLDARKSIAAILFTYLVLGFTVLGFNRTPVQAAVTTASAMLLEVLLGRLFQRRWIWPLSAMITSFSLSILLNYAHDYALLLVPVYFAIGSKYLFTYRGRHVFNPALAGVSFSLLFAGTLITAAPSYQWNGIYSISIFMVMLATVFLLPQVNRHWLVLSFLLAFTLQTALRAFVMRHHLPFETLFLGTLGSPPFFLFTFFMITDPATSPGTRRAQVVTGVLLAFLDLLFHIRQSYFTFFYAAITLAGCKLVFLHARDAWSAGPLAHVRERFLTSSYWLRPVLLAALAVLGVGTYRFVISPRLPLSQLDWRFAEVADTGVVGPLGDTLVRVDPRVQHIAKWVMSVGDAVAVGDFDGDGDPDLFFTQPLKRDDARNALYRNGGGLQFERVPLPAIDRKTVDLEREGIGSNAMFVDYDNDGDLDLFVTYAFGRPILLANQLRESGEPSFVDVTVDAGLDLYTNSVSANFADLNRDGRLDLFVGNVWPTNLPDYDPPRRLNFFDLPEPEYDGDVRMFNFMHQSWHQSDNGGVNEVLLQDARGVFHRQDPAEWGILQDTYWTLAIATADLNQDGWTDLYVANDFGPDNLYYNVEGRRFRKIEGQMFGDIGKDTYKGMNASAKDLDRNGYLDVYVSNVHHAMQAEGSLLWTWQPGEGDPIIRDRATQARALNEDRFGWGATLADFDDDGWIDIAQANGMVDDKIDQRWERCPDYWYVNEKVARSAPSIHRYAHRWGDIRGMCIYGNELDRLYLNRTQAGGALTFVDASHEVGLTQRANSRGMSAVDLDNDGRLDLVVTRQFDPPLVLRNERRGSGVDRHWLGLSLVGDGVTCNRGGIGSVVRVLPEGADERFSQRQEAVVVDGFSAQNDLRLHFGLGAVSGAVDVEVAWCGGPVERFRDVPVDGYRTLTMGGRTAASRRSGP